MQYSRAFIACSDVSASNLMLIIRRSTAVRAAARLNTAQLL
jgi:hypothetical protein